MIRAILRKTPKKLRDDINRAFPTGTARLRGGLAELARWRSIEGRLRSLERAAHRPVEADASIQSWECSNYSQNGEDGILMHIFSRIGGDSFRFLEFGCGNGVECNSNNLTLGFGWGGLLLDWDELNILKAKRFLGAALGSSVGRVEIRRELVTPDNINALIKEAAAEATELDLLSIDVDGNDYWIWNAVDRSRARVVVVEYNSTFGDERAVTATFDREFDRNAKHPSGYYHGASLEALRKLGTSRGYQLVGCDSVGVNAFFVRSDLATGLPSLTTAEAFVPIRERSAVSVADQFALISHLPLVEV
jgi:hypothetical protein